MLRKTKAPVISDGILISGHVLDFLYLSIIKLFLVLQSQSILPTKDGNLQEKTMYVLLVVTEIDRNNVFVSLDLIYVKQMST